MESSRQETRSSSGKNSDIQQSMPHNPLEGSPRSQHHQQSPAGLRRASCHYQDLSVGDELRVLPLPMYSPNRHRSDTFNSVRSTTSSNPYNYITQDHFYNVLQENIRNSSQRDHSVWSQSGPTTPVNDGSHSTSFPAWESTAELIKNASSSAISEMSSVDKREKHRSNTPLPPGILTQPASTSSLPTKPPAGPPAIHFSKPHEILFIANVCLAQLLSLACLAQTVSPLLIISSSLGVDHPGELAWLTAAYSMSLGTFIVPAGRLGDMFGHKKIFVLGFLWLALFSFLCGFAYSWGYVALCVCRGF